MQLAWLEQATSTFLDPEMDIFSVALLPTELKLLALRL